MVFPYWRSGITLFSIASLFLAIYIFLIKPWLIEIQTYDTNIQELTIDKTRLQRLIDQRSETEQKLARLEQLAQISRYYIKASSAKRTNTELIDRITSIIKSNGGEMLSTTPLSSTSEDRIIKLRIHFSGNDDLLIKLLHQLEGNYPILFIDNLYIRTQHRDSLNTTGTRVNSLDIRFDIMGFIEWREY